MEPDRASDTRYLHPGCQSDLSCFLQWAALGLPRRLSVNAASTFFLFPFIFVLCIEGRTSVARRGKEGYDNNWRKRSGKRGLLEPEFLLEGTSPAPAPLSTPVAARATIDIEIALRSKN